MTKRPAKIIMWQSVKNLKWYFHKKASNGKVVAPSQGYASKGGAVRAAKRDHPGLEIVHQTNRPWRGDNA